MTDLAKRSLDVALSGAGLVASAPIWPVIAAAIKWDSPGPIFYAQDRVGEGGRAITVLKFRSWVADAERTVRPRPVVRARLAADPAVVLDHAPGNVGEAGEEVLSEPSGVQPGVDAALRHGHYAAKQIFCKDRLIAWSHRRRFAAGLRLMAPFA